LGDERSTSWVDISQAIGGIATAGALIFVGFQTIQTRKQTRLMQEQIGRAWIGTEKGGISITPDPPLSPRLLVSFKNYGNVPAKVIKWRAKSNTAPLPTFTEFKEELLTSISFEFGELGQYVFPDKTMQIPLSHVEGLPGGLPKGGSFRGKPWVGIVLEYEDVHRSKGEYGFILDLMVGGGISKIDEWFG
jgi:hypothetical protein